MGLGLWLTASCQFCWGNRPSILDSSNKSLTGPAGPTMTEGRNGDTSEENVSSSLLFSARSGRKEPLERHGIGLNTQLGTRPGQDGHQNGDEHGAQERESGIGAEGAVLDPQLSGIGSSEGMLLGVQPALTPPQHPTPLLAHQGVQQSH